MAPKNLHAVVHFGWRGTLIALASPLLRLLPRSVKERIAEPVGGWLARNATVETVTSTETTGG